MWKKPPWRAIGCAAILALPAACANGSPGAGDFCLIYEPVYVSPSDSEETVGQVMRNNAAWVELCDSGDG